MGRKEVTARTEALVEKLLQNTELELVDVEYVREHDWFLRVYIDKEGGVDLNDCQRVSEQLGEILDREDFIAENYLLEVSSPGIDRVIKKDRDILRYTGREVDVKLFAAVDGKKEFTAELSGLTDTGDILLKTDAGEKAWPRAQIAQMRLHFSF